VGTDKSSEVIIAVLDHIDRRFTQFEERIFPKIEDMEKDIRDLQDDALQSKVEKKWLMKISAAAGSLVSLAISLVVSNWQALLAVVIEKKG